MSLVVEVGMMVAFGLSNTPYAPKDTQFPYLYVEKSISDTNFYVSSYNTSRTNAERANKMNPSTALWKTAGGYRYTVDNETFTIEVGHQSEHMVGALDKGSPTESYDFATIKYRVEY